MKRSLIVLVLVAGCGASGQPRGGGSGNGNDGAGGPLIGLYQAGGGTRPSQMCILDRAGRAQFGITLWSPGLRACSGAGTATLSGDRLTLAMAGDSPCTIEARLKDGVVTFPGSLPPTCAYYCGSGAGFAGAVLTRRGATRADALKAKDPAGEPLCGQ
ncbi:MAG TPA: hypothetical protein VFW19_15085 [Allosphingosinicella sp.]|nr:hypothetical protein [Allosphingosinicella sp.]